VPTPAARTEAISEIKRLEDNALAALERLVGLRSGDSVLLIRDPSADDNVVAALAPAVRVAGGELLVVALPEVLEQGREPPAPLRAAMALADIVVLVSRWLPAWVATRAMWGAIHEYGTRVLQIDPPHRLVLEQGVEPAELEEIVGRGRALGERLHGATGLLIVDRFGHELRCEIDSRNCHVSSEFPIDVGFTKLPAGVFTTAVVPGTYRGSIVWDAVEGLAMDDDDAIRACAVDGAVTEVAGSGAGMQHVAVQVAAAAANGRLTEFGVGINASVPARRYLREPWHEAANRSAGVVHFGLGAPDPGSERPPFHTHLVALEATVYALPSEVPLVTSGRI
jgi:hypothetical protein